MIVLAVILASLNIWLASKLLGSLGLVERIRLLRARRRAVPLFLEAVREVSKDPCDTNQFALQYAQALVLLIDALICKDPVAVVFAQMRLNEAEAAMKFHELVAPRFQALRDTIAARAAVAGMN